MSSASPFFSHLSQTAHKVPPRTPAAASGAGFGDAQPPSNRFFSPTNFLEEPAKRESRNISTVSRTESTDGSADTSLPYICKLVSPKPPYFYYQEIGINRSARRTKKDAPFDRPPPSSDTTLEVGPRRDVNQVARSLAQIQTGI